MADHSTCDIYGWLDCKGVLYIVDKTKESLNLVNGHTIYTHKKCFTHTKLELVPIMYKLGIPPPEEYSYAIDWNLGKQIIISNWEALKVRNESIDDVEAWPYEKVYSYAQYIQVGKSKGHKYTKPRYYCPLIEQAMIDQGLVVYEEI